MRIALGARPQHIIFLVTREALRVAFGGIMTGLLLTYTLVRVAGHAIFEVNAASANGMLFGISPTDPKVYLTIGLAVSAAVAGASLVAARRALGVSPAQLLRTE